MYWPKNTDSVRNMQKQLNNISIYQIEKSAGKANNYTGNVSDKHDKGFTVSQRLKEIHS